VFKNNGPKRVSIALLVVLVGVSVGSPGLAQDNAVLRGVVLLVDPAQVRMDGVVATSHGGFIDATATPWISAAELEPYLQPQRGAALDQAMVEALTAAITEFHTEKFDEPFVNVALPPQEATSGIVQVVVQRGRLGSITIEGREWYSEDSYLRYFDLRPGQPIKLRSLNAGSGSINRSNFRQVRPEAKAGVNPGETDLVLQAQETYPVSVRGGYDNTGTKLTSRYRYNAGVTWGNAFGIGHELSYDFITDPGFEYSKTHRFGYYAPLASGDGVSVTAMAGDSKSKLPEPFDQSGTSRSLSGRYIMPKPDWKLFGFSSTLQAGFDFKRADNQLEFNEVAVNASTTDIAQFVVDFSGSRTDNWGGTGARVGLFVSPGNLTTFNTDQRFESVRAGSDPRYYYINGEVTRSFDLPEGYGLNHRLNLQYTPYRLIGSEQLSIAGHYAVRGYPESDANGDYGMVLRNEFLFPAFSPQKLLKLDMPADRLRFHLFYDVGNARQRSALADEKDSLWLRSIGFGFNYGLGRFVNARLDVGRGLSRNLQTESEGTQIHFGMSLTY
jgi:hemolysin activation/secretion protein